VTTPPRGPRDRRRSLAAAHDGQDSAADRRGPVPPPHGAQPAGAAAIAAADAAPPPGVAFVDDFDGLARTPFSAGTPALCWRRTLDGDFDEVLHHVAPREGLVVLSPHKLRRLPLQPAGRRAVEAMLHDMARLHALGFAPELNCIAGYARDERGLAIATDVMSFHVDESPVETATWMCTYAGPATEGLAPDDAVRAVDLPDIRAALHASWCARGSDDGDEAEDFDAWLSSGSFHLHYRAREGARPFSFGAGHLWRVAVAWPGSPVPAFVHRAPSTTTPRLLLLC
jgi:hypothetical protein